MARSIPRYDLDVLFQELYTQIEKRYISRILLLLGDYMVMDTDMLFKAYRRRFGEYTKSPDPSYTF